ncbi:hypothetical protein EMIT0P12_70006 [Pseudomonas sp. IT-P12]
MVAGAFLSQCHTAPLVGACLFAEAVYQTYQEWLTGCLRERAHSRRDLRQTQKNPAGARLAGAF